MTEETQRLIDDPAALAQAAHQWRQIRARRLRDVVEGAPALTDEQVDRLRALLPPADA